MSTKNGVTKERGQVFPFARTKERGQVFPFARASRACAFKKRQKERPDNHLADSPGKGYLSMLNDIDRQFARGIGNETIWWNRLTFQ